MLLSNPCVLSVLRVWQFLKSRVKRRDGGWSAFSLPQATPCPTLRVMSDKPLHHPHDKLFKSTFGDPANATGFLRGELPAALSAALDWDHLQLEPGSFIDSHYKSSAPRRALSRCGS